MLWPPHWQLDSSEPDLVQRTYDLALLEHIGCTAVSAEIAHIMGDELVMEHAATLDFADHKQMFRFIVLVQQ